MTTRTIPNRRVEIFDGRTQSPSARDFWLWPTRLTLRAPLVAVLWQILLATSLGLPLNSFAPWALASAVWLIYVADHLIDNARPKRGLVIEPPRKEFCRKALGEILGDRDCSGLCFGGWSDLLPVVGHSTNRPASGIGRSWVLCADSFGSCELAKVGSSGLNHFDYGLLIGIPRRFAARICARCDVERSGASLVVAIANSPADPICESLWRIWRFARR